MNIKYITCSDPRNHNSHDELFDLWRMDPRVEIAVQMHPGKVSADTERYKWIKQLVEKLQDYPFVSRTCNLAIHVNNNWCDDICNGKIPDELKPLFRARYKSTFKHIIGRIQLNMPQKTADNFNPQKLKPVIDFYDKQDFIIQYNARTKDAVDELHKTGAKFQLLFDASGGRGIDVTTWCAPVFPGKHMQGYSGGLSQENVAENLNKIAMVAGNYSIWTDAEGKLKTDDKFDPMRAKQYITNALAWEQKHR